MNADVSMITDAPNRSISVLHIVNRWGKGGVERFIEGMAECSIGRSVDHSALSICTDVESTAPLKAKYGPLCHGEGLASILRGAARLGSFLEMHSFDAVHIHASNGSCFLFAEIAKREGVPIRIVHSHNSSMQAGSGIIKKLAHRLLQSVFIGSETKRLACSSEAGYHLFNKRRFEVIPNGIETKRFLFSSENRQVLRKEMGISEGDLLILCVGSLIEAKNHARSLAIFDLLHRGNPNSYLMILGDGPLREKLEKDIEDRDIANFVSMPGYVKDSERWLSAADVLLFPSLYEGLPIALVEAQCNGLPIVCSDSVTREVGILDSIRFVPLDAGDDEWVCQIGKCKREDSLDFAERIAYAGYDREMTASRLLKIYGVEAGS